MLAVMQTHPSGAHAARLRDLCATELGIAVSSIEVLCVAKSVADDPSKWLLRDNNGEPAAVVKCASQAAPDLVAREAAIARQVKASLGSTIGSPVVEILASGSIDGLSYMVMPYHRPLSRSRLVWQLQRWQLSGALFAWLRAAVHASVATPSEDQVASDFHLPLRCLADDADFGDGVRSAARQALARLESGEWVPRYSLYHNDLWRDNILLRTRSGAEGGRYPFVIIDWAGARLRGHAIYDLVRLAGSMRLSAQALRGEVTAHCQSLGCDASVATSYLLAGLGYLGMHLEAFPKPRYLASAERYFNTLRKVLPE